MSLLWFHLAFTIWVNLHSRPWDFLNMYWRCKTFNHKPLYMLSLLIFYNKYLKSSFTLPLNSSFYICNGDNITSSFNWIVLYRLILEDTKFVSSTKKLCGLLALWKKQSCAGDGKGLVCEDSGLGSQLVLWLKMPRKVTSMNFLALGGDKNQMM